MAGFTQADTFGGAPPSWAGWPSEAGVFGFGGGGDGGGEFGTNGGAVLGAGKVPEMGSTGGAIGPFGPQIWLVRISRQGGGSAAAGVEVIARLDAMAAAAAVAAKLLPSRDLRQCSAWRRSGNEAPRGRVLM